MSVYNSYKTFADILRITQKCPEISKLTEIYRSYLQGLKYESFKAILRQYQNVCFMQGINDIDSEQEIKAFENDNPWLVKPENVDDNWKPEPEQQTVIDNEIVAFKAEHWAILRKALYDNPDFIRLFKEALSDQLIRSDDTKFNQFKIWETEIKEFFPKSE